MQSPDSMQSSSNPNTILYTHHTQKKIKATIKFVWKHKRAQRDKQVSRIKMLLKVSSDLISNDTAEV